MAVPVRIRLGESRIDGVTINVSEHGMYVFAAANLTVGADIDIAFCPPGQKRVRACGIVRRKAVYLYGIELVTKPEASGDRTSAPTQSNVMSVGA
jgi:PilZ domain